MRILPRANSGGVEMSLRLIFRYCFIICVSFILSQSVFAYERLEPNVAGTFYPDDAAKLAKAVDGYLKNTILEPINGEIFALILPHAGYGYSGPTAAFGYKSVKGKNYKTVVIIGTSHHYAFNGASVYKEGEFLTPLGGLKIDSEFTKELLGKDPEISFEKKAFEKEHSVEVQLPFLERSLNNFKIVPIVLGDLSYATCQKLAMVLKNAIGNRKDVLVVVSTDLYHGYNIAEANSVDNQTLSSIKSMDPEKIYYELRDGKIQMCGGFGVVTAVILAKELNHNKAFLLHHTNSAEVTGNKKDGNWTVGYASLVIDQLKEEKNMFNINQRRKLLEIARNSIDAYLKTDKKLTFSETDPGLSKDLGAFVTLRVNEDLRGCIGSMTGRGPLYKTISEMAVEAAVRDPRFPAVIPRELKNIEIEISVLSPMEKVNGPEDIILGKHGVLLKKGFFSAVFLPQVATETNWSKEEFLSHLASKAGLEPLAWKDKNAEFYCFTAEVFSEKEILKDK